MTQLPEWLRTYPPAQRAALIVHLEEIELRGRSELPHVVVAERAGVGRSAVVMAVATAWARHDLMVQSREGEPSVIRLPRGKVSGTAAEADGG
ncbi:hypothetical protein ELH42_16915 [Rhizobium ruizarguesonis]|uniref:hypothetical protein n=1 Tax=Rhizobium ruizarguesonis TaxID=2081791 RepID=UPI001031A7A6|nr:hypothetical protein [Rhizobium ruizarguesonis]TBB67737.1 hypothetical protein ELH42_16915 [Rhizobium ruizarguesonis]